MIGVIGDSILANSGFAHESRVITWSLAKKYDVMSIGSLVDKFPWLERDIKKTKIKFANEEREVNYFVDSSGGIWALKYLKEKIDFDALIFLDGPWTYSQHAKSLELIKYIRKIFPNTKLILKVFWDGEPLENNLIFEISKLFDNKYITSIGNKKSWEQFKKEKIHLIEEAIDLTLFKKFKREKKTDEFIVGSSQKNVGRKNLNLLVKAFNKFAKDKDDIRLFLTAAYPEYEPQSVKWSNLSDEQKEKLILKTADKPYEDYLKELSQFDINVNISWGEAFGIPAIEGFAFGIPYIATDFSNSHYLIYEEPDSSRGAGVEVKDYETKNICGGIKIAIPSLKSLVEILNQYYYNRDLIGKQGKNAKRYVRRFDISNIKYLWLKFIDEVLES